MRTPEELLDLMLTLNDETASNELAKQHDSTSGVIWAPDTLADATIERLLRLITSPNEEIFTTVQMLLLDLNERGLHAHTAAHGDLLLEIIGLLPDNVSAPRRVSEAARALAERLLDDAALQEDHIGRLVRALTDNAISCSARNRAYQRLEKQRSSGLAAHAETLITLLQHAASEVRDAAAKLLHALMPAERAIDANHAGALTTLLQHAASEVREKAAKLLHALTQAELAPYADRLDDIRRTIEDVEEGMSETARTLLRRLLGLSEHERKRAREGPPPAFPKDIVSLRALLRSNNDGTRKRALGALRTLCSRDAGGLSDLTRDLVDLLQHASVKVRASAVELLTAELTRGKKLLDDLPGNPLPPEILYSLASLLEHLDEGVRDAARLVFVSLNLDVLAIKGGDANVLFVARHARQELKPWLYSIADASKRLERFYKIVDLARAPDTIALSEQRRETASKAKALVSEVLSKGAP